MITPLEAFEMWCPFGRVKRFASSINRDDDATAPKPHLVTHCVSDECMAWRWATSALVEGRKKGSDDPWTGWNWDPRTDKNGSYEREDFEFRDAERKGFCGFAGRPL